MQKKCASVGVKLVYTPCLPKAPINGSTRWINDNPCIQLSGGHNRNDIFWFAFFHEIGDVLLHGKKDIFLEDIDYSDKQLDKEKEADNFVSNFLLPFSQEKEIVESGDFSNVSICKFAEKFEVHPGIIVGRLQHLGLLSHNEKNDLFEKVNLFKNIN